MVPSAGAVGGLGGAPMTCLHASMRSGAELLIEITGWGQRIKQTDLVITGEGSLDHQSLMGKVTVAVDSIAREYNKPVIVLAGRFDTVVDEINHYFDGVFSIQTDCRTLEEAMHEETMVKQLKVTARQIMRVIDLLN